MELLEEINVPSDKLSAGLSHAIRLCYKISQSKDNYCNIKLSGTSFITPAFILPFIVYAESIRHKKISISGCAGYVHSVGFDKFGIDTSMMRASEFIAYMEGFARKTYMPLLKFLASERDSDERMMILTAVENLLIKQASLPSNIVSGLKYMIGELTDNISEHSHSEYGYIIAQCYQSSGYVDICIGDTGRTLLGSYRDNGINDVDNDVKALMSAVSGTSIKNYPGAENRGFGISTSRNMIANGMGGQYLMLSGSAVYIKTKEHEGCMTIPHGIRFNGTIVALRIPYNNKDFTYLRFIETR